jgi:hypothetical protein
MSLPSRLSLAETAELYDGADRLQYIKGEVNIEKRRIALEQLEEISEVWEYSQDTLFLAIAYFEGALYAALEDDGSITGSYLKVYFGDLITSF